MSVQSSIDSVIQNVKSKHAAGSERVVSTPIDVQQFGNVRGLAGLSQRLRAAGYYSGLFRTPQTPADQYELRTVAI